MPMETWECEECGYTVTRKKKPELCPECGTHDSFFLVLGGEEDEEDLDGFDDLEDIPEDEEEEEDEGDDEDEDEY